MVISKRTYTFRAARLLGTALVWLTFVGADSSRAASYTFTTLDDPSNTAGTFARGINDSGEVVGYYVANGTENSFSYSGGSYTTFSAHGVYETVALAVNDAGEIAGYEDEISGTQCQFLYNGGTNYTDTLDWFSYSISGENIIVTGVNNEGQIVGNVSSTNSGYLETYALQQLTGDVPCDEVASLPGGYLDPQTTVTLQFPKSEAGSTVTSTQATGVNDEGEVVGFFIGSDPNLPNSDSAHGFFYNNGVYSYFDDPNAVNGTFAEGINNGDVIVGYYVDEDGISHGFIFNQPTGSYATVNVPGAANTFIYGINNSNDIVGAYVDSSGKTHGFEGTTGAGGSSSLTDTHDFNADGKSGILWQDTSGDTALWLMNGAAILQSAGVGTVPPSVWSIAGQRDFNGDGKADILWHDTSGDVAVWLMNGTTISQSLGVGNANPSVWSIVGTGDFFGNGNAGVLWRDTSGDVAIWELSGNTIVQSCGVGNAPASWSIAGTGDFNGDGFTDILWHDTAGDVAIWELNGCTILQSLGVGTVNPTVWSIAGTGDFSGVGRSDILWHDTSGDVAIWFMNGATITQSSGVGTASPSVWSIAQTGDYYGAGTSDILWRDTSGDVAVWEMNGATIVQSAGIGTASTSWSIQDAGAE